MVMRIIRGTDGRDLIFAGRSNDHIIAGAGADFIRSGGGNDLIEAGDGRDFVFAGSGDDIVDTGAGNDFADGGRGTDTARYAGNFADYKITVFGRLIFVTDLTTGERDTLRSFELLQFADGVYDPYAANNAPLADDIAATFVQGDAPLTLDLLAEANPFDLDGDVVEIVSVETNARLAFDPVTGMITYDPGDDFGNLGANQTRLDSFTFELTDGTDTISRTIEITVQGVNDLPTGAVLVTGEVKEGETLTADTSGLDDPDGIGVLSYQWQSSSDDGATWDDIAGATGETFTPREAEVGRPVRVVISYTDDGGTDEQVESQPTDPVVAASGPPIAVADEITVNDDFSSILIDVLANDSDPDNDPLTIFTVDFVGPLPPGLLPVIALEGNQVEFTDRDPSLYTSLQEGESEVVELRYRVIDGNGGAAESTLTITIEGTNQAPVVAGQAGETIAEDSGIQSAPNDADQFVFENNPNGGNSPIVTGFTPGENAILFSGFEALGFAARDGNGDGILTGDDDRLAIDGGLVFDLGWGNVLTVENIGQLDEDNLLFS